LEKALEKPNKERIVLYWVRHGLTEENKEHKFRGSDDPPLIREGVIDSLKLQKWLADKPLSFAVSSKKKRTIQTLRNILADRPEIPRAHVEELTPWDTGFGGKPKNEENLKKLQGYIENPDKTPPNGVSLSDWRKVIRPVITEAVIMGLMSENPGLLVVHSSIGHEISELITGDHTAGHVKPGGAAAVILDSKGRLTVRPLLKPDSDAKTQNALGVADKKTGRGALTS
jgi:broad specificity phosphatase PhoE